MKQQKCPQCSGKIIEVPRHSNWLNDDQYAAVKAGDYYCEKCPDNNRGRTGLFYIWNHELPDALEYQI